MIYFGVELYAPYFFVLYLVCGYLDVFSGCYCLEVVGDGGYRIAVRHPHLTVVGDSGKEGVGLVERTEVRPAVFACSCRTDFSAVCVCYVLRSVTDSENGVFADYTGKVGFERVFVIDREGAARQYDAFYGFVAVREFVVREYLAICI